MIAPEPYGWGAFGLPVCRQPTAAAGAAGHRYPPFSRRHLPGASAWAPLLGSGLAALFAIGAVLLLAPSAPLEQEKAPPVAIVYSLPEKTLPPPPPAPPPPVRTLSPPIRKEVPRPAPSYPRPQVAPARSTPPATERPVRQSAPPPAAGADRTMPLPKEAAPTEMTIDLDPSLRRPAPRPAAELLPRRNLTLERAPQAQLPPATAGAAAQPRAPATLPPPSALTLDAGEQSGARIDMQPSTPAAPRHRTGSAQPVPVRTTFLPGRQEVGELAMPEVKRQLPGPTSAERTQNTSFAFLDALPAAELDRSFLVDLSRLSTCLDPGAEIALKTRLAALLSRPGRCRAGGMIFAVLYPESAYSIHIDLYNYERREFADRCAALRQTVECFEARR